MYERCRILSSCLLLRIFFFAALSCHAPIYLVSSQRGALLSHNPSFLFYLYANQLLISPHNSLSLCSTQTNSCFPQSSIELHLSGADFISSHDDNDNDDEYMDELSDIESSKYINTGTLKCYPEFFRILKNACLTF